eukprot:CAMPEP_0115000628 /NCGR_PEP_ID=MMETSP0216-20121206/16874_1 /TAXON_ID=223996 /ORGANISM="Protocruzia adherens, Strain Boccale" /LENGTH=474 /DNA_ID=CAMNT_0002365769 /DNA_START=37 /DNA_END=1456 /DNA_ORIENTATION=-
MSQQPSKMQVGSGTIPSALRSTSACHSQFVPGFVPSVDNFASEFWEKSRFFYNQHNPVEYLNAKRSCNRAPIELLPTPLFGHVLKFLSLEDYQRRLRSASRVLRSKVDIYFLSAPDIRFSKRVVFEWDYYAHYLTRNRHVRKVAFCCKEIPYFDSLIEMNLHLQLSSVSKHINLRFNAPALKTFALTVGKMTEEQVLNISDVIAPKVQNLTLPNCEGALQFMEQLHVKKLTLNGKWRLQFMEQLHIKKLTLNGKWRFSILGHLSRSFSSLEYFECNDRIDWELLSQFRNLVTLNTNTKQLRENKSLRGIIDDHHCIQDLIISDEKSGAKWLESGSITLYNKDDYLNERPGWLEWLLEKSKFAHSHPITSKIRDLLEKRTRLALGLQRIQEIQDLKVMVNFSREFMDTYFQNINFMDSWYGLVLNSKDFCISVPTKTIIISGHKIEVTSSSLFKNGKRPSFILEPLLNNPNENFP